MTPEALKEWRERLGFTKTQACAALGLSPNAYAAYERGYLETPVWGGLGNPLRRPRPIPKHIALACKALALGLSPHP